MPPGVCNCESVGAAKGLDSVRARGVKPGLDKSRVSDKDAVLFTYLRSATLAVSNNDEAGKNTYAKAFL